MVQVKSKIGAEDLGGTGGLFEDFLGAAGADLPSPWAVHDTSTSGSPTTDYVTAGAGGLFRLANDSTSEAQNLALYWGDNIAIAPTATPYMEARIRLNTAGATFTADQRLVVGLAAARNATLDSNASHVWFRIEGANLNILIEGDDGVTDTNDTDTGIDYVDNEFLVLGIDMTTLSAVKFYVDGVEVATTIDVSALLSDDGLQPYIEMQRDANTEVETLDIDYVFVRSGR